MFGYCSLPIFNTPGDTNLPLNCNDEDLGMDVQIEAKPAYIATDMSLELVKYKMAEQQRKASFPPAIFLGFG